MGKHAFLSPSFAHIGYRCPAAGIRSFQVDQRRELLRQVASEFYGLTDDGAKERLSLSLAEDNSAAVEGTAFHEIFEKFLCLRKPFKDDTVVKDIKAHKDITDYTKGDDYIITSFCRVLREEAKFLKGLSWFDIEYRVHVKGLPQFGTMDVVAYHGDTLYIRDLKTGRNQVSAEENEQLMTYAVGVLDDIGWDKFKRVEISIIGVRFASNTWVTTPKKLFKFKNEVMLPAFIEAYSINPQAKPGSHCHYCSGKIHCAEWQEKFNKVNNELFNDLNVRDHDNDGLVELYKLCKQAENLAKYQLAPELLQRFEGFDAPENIKRVSGARKELWKNEEEAVNKLSKVVGNKNLLYKQTILTPKQVKAQLGSEDEVNKLIKITQNKPYLKV